MNNKSYCIDDLLDLMSRLREPVFGCPWDQVQSYQTIVASTLEEAYEVVDAIEQGDSQQLKEELGDLLFQVIFYSQLGKEDEQFTFADIVSQLTGKLIRRHPHVFPEGTLDSRISSEISDADRAVSEANIKASWELIKQQERKAKGHHGLLDDIPNAFPAAVRAQKLQKRAASVGFDWRDHQDVYVKIEEEITELKEAQLSGDDDAIEDELGDLLFTVINLSRHLRVDAETALRRANRKFEQRFRLMEVQAEQDEVDFSAQTDSVKKQYWDQAKKALLSAD